MNVPVTGRTRTEITVQSGTVQTFARLFRPVNDKTVAATDVENMVYHQRSTADGRQSSNFNRCRGIHAISVLGIAVSNMTSTRRLQCQSFVA